VSASQDSTSPARAYYDEHDKYAAAWLRNLIAAGLIPDGDVDTRSIVDVRAEDLIGYRQCHFFAGVGGWAYAARLAGWPDDAERWTGSCPCQPFSVAGERSGTNDPRHLWPDVFRLICERRPAVFVGEQVPAAVGHGWLDGVCADLESLA
jgi:DNA (cytosine-5)-methyltransferase 1